MPRDLRREVGSRGERIAADFLIAKGYEIVARNWRRGKMGELDLVVRREREVRVIEVKTLAHSEEGHPEDFVTESKLARLADLAEIFAAAYRISGGMHLDVIAVTFVSPNDPPQVEWLKDV